MKELRKYMYYRSFESEMFHGKDVLRLNFITLTFTETWITWINAYLPTDRKQILIYVMYLNFECWERNNF